VPRGRFCWCSCKGDPPFASFTKRKEMALIIKLCASHRHENIERERERRRRKGRRKIAIK